MSYRHSIISSILASVHENFTSSKNDLINAIDTVLKSTTESIKNTQAKMESCIEAIARDYVTYPVPITTSSPTQIYQNILNEYSHSLYYLYLRANIDYNKILDKYLKKKTTSDKMVNELKKKIEKFYIEIQTSLSGVVRNCGQEEILRSLQRHEKVHDKKCFKFKTQIDKLFFKVNKKCVHDTQDFDKYVNKLILNITSKHIEILENFLQRSIVS